MDFLKALFGDKALTFDELSQAINAHNGDEANKDNQIKVGNLGGGEYVGKARHESELERLNTLLSGKDTDIQSLKETLESLKKGKVDAEAIQQKLTEAETKLAESKKREDETKVKYALRDVLRDNNVSDVDYAEYLVNKSLKETGNTLELDDNEKIKGADDLIKDLKVSSPGIFKKEESIKVEELQLDGGDKDHQTEPQTLAEALKMKYENDNN